MIDLNGTESENAVEVDPKYEVLVGNREWMIRNRVAMKILRRSWRSALLSVDFRSGTCINCTLH